MAHKNDVGTRLLITVKDDGEPVDISTAISRQVILKRPDDSIVNRSASVFQDGSATSGVMYYDTILGDFSEAGIYKLQGKLITASGTYFTDLYTFKVQCNLE